MAYLAVATLFFWSLRLETAENASLFSLFFGDLGGRDWRRPAVPWWPVVLRSTGPPLALADDGEKHKF